MTNKRRSQQANRQAKGQQASRLAPTAMSLVLISIVLLWAAAAVDAGAAEGRAASQTAPTATSRNPPFNGSMYGKRSILAPANFAGPESPSGGGAARADALAALSAAAAALGALEQPIAPSRLELMIQQQAALTRASIGQCLAQQRRQQPQSAIAGTYCAELFAAIQTQDENARESLAAKASWLDQLLQA